MTNLSNTSLTHTYTESFIRSNIPCIKFDKPEGTYLCWLDVREALQKIPQAPPTDSDEASIPESISQQYLVEHANIHLNTGSSYGFSGSNRMRMNIATSRHLVELALNNLANALVVV